MAKLNIDTFNALMFQALEGQSPQRKLELLRIELDYAYGVKINTMEQLVKELNEGSPYAETLGMVNSADSICEKVGHCIDALLEEYPELKDSSEGNEKTVM